MSVELHYDGQHWQLAASVERSSCQGEIMRLCGSGGGIAEFELDDGRKLALLISPSIPITVVDGHASTYTRLP